MAARNIIGIDVGTTTVKAAVIAPDGQVLDRFAQSYATHRSGPNHVEQSPDDWMRLVSQALDHFAGYEVAAIGMCSQVNTHVFVCASGEALRPAILWQDGRAGKVAGELDSGISDAQKEEWWGSPMPIDASHAIARMAWVARHEPEIWGKTRYVLLPKDFCIWRMTGDVSTDPISNVGLVGADMGYIDGVLALVPGAADRVAPIRDVTGVAGTMASGPFRGVPVVNGTMDAWAGLVGAGAGREGVAVYLSGTSEVMGISSRAVRPSEGAIVFPEYQGLRIHAGPTQSGGDAVQWFAGVSGMTLAEMAEAVAATPRSQATPLFMPQLEGERAPLWDADLRAGFLNVSRRTARADFCRAVYEGVALSARHALEAVRQSADTEVGLIHCGGGGFRSAAWNQIRADILGVPLKTIGAAEPGVMGAAMIAGIGSGQFADFADAAARLASAGGGISARSPTAAIL
ncbi:xylulokinase [Paracoccus albus]|uniref:xylulokinase n=1 Tax=Paracoccus albus TaxID=3017784 RepID=UPI0022F0E8CA|nr:FGGY-family carbohydrate kinase [Paracoccus albus]WBU61707.1 FGGY-family carbohydrate kinase [Paracoccus albus]